jgi:hypothetical protein
VLALGYDGEPTPETIALCEAHGIRIEPKGTKYVGAFIGRDEEADPVTLFVMEQTEKHTSIFGALMNSFLAAILRHASDEPPAAHDGASHELRNFEVSHHKPRPWIMLLYFIF